VEAKIAASAQRKKTSIELTVAFAWRVLLFAALWWILTEGSIASWWFGAPLIIVASVMWLSVGFAWGGSVSVPAVLRFAGYFTAQSLLGGVDVAFRALRPSMPLSPGFVRYRWRLPPGDARMLLVNCVSLLPGTLSAEIHEDELLVHALDTRQDVIRGVRVLEDRIAAAFRIRLVASA
jgi:multicomponent Na+:H+ antiporter subunit E